MSLSERECALLDTATVRVFRVPGVGEVRVEIGDVARTSPVTGHSYPAYRVAVNGVTVMAGTDWGVPRHQAVDSMDSALSLLLWVSEGEEEASFDRDRLGLWVSDRRDLRDALTAPGVYWRDAVEKWREGR